MKKLSGQNLLLILQLRGISKKVPKVMEGLSKMKRRDCLGPFWEIIGQQNIAYLLEGLSKIEVPGTRQLSQLSPLSPLSFRSEPRPAAQSHPSTRAGGQDDGSYTNSLKLVNVTCHEGKRQKRAGEETRAVRSF